MPAEERLQDDVVERERQGRHEHDQRPPYAVEREALAGAERDDDRDADERDGEADQASRDEPIEPEEDGEHERHRRGESDDQRGDARRRVALADVQGDVVPETTTAGRDDASASGRVKPGSPRARQRMNAKPGAAIA